MAITLNEFLAECKAHKVEHGTPEVRGKRRLLPVGRQILVLAPDSGANGLIEVADFGERAVELEIVAFTPNAIAIRAWDRKVYAR